MMMGEESKEIGGGSLEKLTSQAKEMNRLSLELAKTQKRLVLAESRLGAPVTMGAQHSSGGASSC